jgi:hypothetical protein
LRTPENLLRVGEGALLANTGRRQGGAGSGNRKPETRPFPGPVRLEAGGMRLVSVCGVLRGWVDSGGGTW